MSQVLEAEPWDHTYKGDSFWLKVRKETLRLILREVAVNWQDVQADPWFQKESGMLQAGQWERACSQRLVPNRPAPTNDSADFVRFFVEGKGGRKWYLSLRDEVHCASEIAVRKEHIATNRAGQQIRRLRETWNATTEDTCNRCKRYLVQMSQ